MSHLLLCCYILVSFPLVFSPYFQHASLPLSEVRSGHKNVSLQIIRVLVMLPSSISVQSSNKNFFSHAKETMQAKQNKEAMLKLSKSPKIGTVQNT